MNKATYFLFLSLLSVLVISSQTTHCCWDDGTIITTHDNPNDGK